MKFNQLAYLALLFSQLIAWPQLCFAAFPQVNGCTPEQRTVASGTINLTIADLSTVTNSINVAGFNSPVFDVDVITNINHTNNQNLTIKLTSPAGRTVTLSKANGGTFDNGFAGTTWDDQARDPVRRHSFGANGVVTPLTPQIPLSGFTGESPNGLWTISIGDSVGPDTGSLADWAVRITTCAPAAGFGQTFAVTFPVALAIPPAGELILTNSVTANTGNLSGTICSLALGTKLDHAALDELKIELESPIGTKALVTAGNKIQVPSGLDVKWVDADGIELTDPPSALALTTVQTEEPFSVFYGESAAGVWKLHVTDTVSNGTNGTLSKWYVLFNNCGFRPIFNDQLIGPVEELTPNGSVVGTVQAEEIFNLGKRDNSGPGNLQNAGGDGLIFNNPQPITIRSVTMFPNAPGTVDISLHPFISATQMPAISTSTQTLPYGGSDVRSVLPLNMAVPSPVQGKYLLQVSTETIGNLKRNTGVDFTPFSVPGVAQIEIDSGTLPGVYSGFYNWEISTAARNLNFSIASGNAGNAFAINPNTGAISIANTNAIRFATTPSYTLLVDAISPQNVKKQAVVTIPVSAHPAPKITCPADTSVVDGASISTAAVGAATAVDLIDPVVTPAFVDTVTSASCPLARKVFREWKAIDSDGNSSSCTQTISVTDLVSDDRNGNGIIECEGELGTTDVNGQCVPGAGDCYYAELRSTACVGANGFLGQINIASVINLQPGDLQATVQYFNAGGSLVNQVSTSIASNLKTDFIINDLGLQPDTIGTVCVVTNAGGPGAWTGGISIYKPDVRNGTPAFGERFDFALYYPFLNPSAGTTTTPLNTFHLGTSPAALVANWISIIDAVRGDSQGVSGVINVFDASGNVLQSLPVNLPDGGRADFPGHEALSGLQNADAVGLAQFVPSNSANYYMTLTRYFYDCPGASCTNFLTAFNIPRRPGSAQGVTGNVSTFDGELAIVELNNVTANNGDAALEVFSGFGGSAGQQTIPVPARATRHVIVNSTGTSGFLANGEIGSAKVQATNGSLSALSIFYKLNPATGGLQYAYAAPLVESPGVAQLSQFNTFIGHSNRIELVNSTAGAMTAQVTFFDYLGANVLNTNVVIAPKQTIQLDTKALPVNSYGTFTVQAGAAGIIVRNYVSRPGEYTVPYLGE